MADPLRFTADILLQTHITADSRRKRLLVFLAWLLLVAWLFSQHVLWRDEVRAYSLALAGAGVGDMLRTIHGEGHPAIWYLILRGVHAVLPSREMLPIAGALIGVAAMAIFTFASPFRTWVIAAGLFSLFGAFEYVIVARNYGIAALILFCLAATYWRVRNGPVFGMILAILCNTNVPSCIIAAGFLLYRFVEMLSDAQRPSIRAWTVFIVNAALALAGAIACFATVYPPFNGGAVSKNLEQVSASAVLAALGGGGKGFTNLVLNARGALPPIFLWGSCLALVRRPPAVLASLAALAALKLFFYFVYPSSYRHEALFVVFLLALHWISAQSGELSVRSERARRVLEALGTFAFCLLLLLQTADLLKPLSLQARGVPYSRSADVGRLLERPELRGAIVMADPDIMLEPLPFYAGNPLWFVREKQFAKLYLRSTPDRHRITLDDLLGDARRLHQSSGGPVVILLHADLAKTGGAPRRALYRDTTDITPDGIARFVSATRKIATLRPAITDESYDVYVYRG